MEGEGVLAVKEVTDRPPVINDFSITVATVNGSGSQTANLTLMRALFRMGIPVSGKNIFPSNIQGLPTWYTIRVNKDGFLAHRDEIEIMIAMNPQSFPKDLARVQPGGVFFYADDIKQPITREDVSVYPMPVKKLAHESEVTPQLREYIANMVFVGVLAEILCIDLNRIYEALNFHFKGKKKAIDMNFNVVKAAADWSAANLHKADPFVAQSMDATNGYILADGNTAAALGSIYGGVQFAAWYPITPASSLAEGLNEYLPKLRNDPKSGKATYAVVQAEDEIAAIGMTLGAGFSGLRSMTSTSGPGLSLMCEYAGLAYYAEVPLVIWDVQRVGPSTGLPTRSAQGDITMVNYFSHGDTRQIMLFPGSVSECFEFGWRAFDLAEHLQTPIFIMTDLDLGMNTWMTNPFTYPDQPMDRGKVLWEEDIERLKGQWERYRDVDGDGIPYRTVPGNRHPQAAWFARGTGHNENARYSEDPETWERNMLRLNRKYETARKMVPASVLDNQPGARVGIIAYGSTELAVREAREALLKEDLPTDFLRLRSIPFPEDVLEFINSHERVYVVEMNRDGQMRQLLSAESPCEACRLISVAHNDGLPLTARWIFDQIKLHEEELS